MLIVDAELEGARIDLRIANGRVTAMAPFLKLLPGERCFDARGGMILPGLHDHHIHLFGLAAALASVRCGDVSSAAGLASHLAGAGGEGWLRGIGYHESIAGELDRVWLDQCGSARPIRIQHRSGRLWVFNSRALEVLAEIDPELAPLERVAGRLSGRLYDGDAWLRECLRSIPPDLDSVSAQLAQHGITAVTDASFTNDANVFASLAAAAGALAQDVKVMGDLSLASVCGRAGCDVGAYKIHLHDGSYPDPDACIAAIAAETQGAVAIELFPNNQLGGDPSMLSQIRSGALELATFPGTVVSTLVPVMALPGIGFAYSGYDKVWASMDGELGDFLRAQLVKAQLHPFDTVWDNGFRQITTSTKPILTPADLQRFKIRVPVVPLWVAMFKALQAAPISIPLRCSRSWTVHVSSMRVAEILQPLSMRCRMKRESGCPPSIVA